MDIESLMDAIVRPVQIQHPTVHFEPELLLRLAQDAAESPSYLPLLQVTLEDLWRRGRLRLGAYFSLTDAIAQRADAVLKTRDLDGAPTEGRSDDEQRTILAILLEMVEVSLHDDTRQDLRRQRSYESLVRNDPLREELINDLIDARLLSSGVEFDAIGQARVVDIIHERLLYDWPRLKDEINQARTQLQQRARFELRLRDWRLNPKHVLEGFELSSALDLVTRDDVSIHSFEAQKFLQESQLHAQALESERQSTLRQLDVLANRAAELRIINEINTSIAELMAPEQVTRLLVYMIQQQFGYPTVSLLLRDSDSLVVQSSVGDTNGRSRSDARLPADRGLIGWVMRSHQVLRVDDTTQDERFVELLPDDARVRSVLVVPIMLRREILGVLDVRSPEIAAFGPSDEAVLSAIVNQFSIALGNARLLENEQQRIFQLNQVNRLSLAITAQLDAPQNLQLAADGVAMIFNVRQAGLILLGNHERQGGALVAIHGDPTPYDSDLTQLIFTRPELSLQIQQLREPLLVRNLRMRPEYAVIAGFLKARSIDDVLLVPLLVGQHSLGVLCVDATGREEGFGRADIELATMVAQLLTQVIKNLT